MSRVCREELPRLLEAVFDELAPGLTHYRFERLELELGVLPVDDLGQALLGRVREAVREALEQAGLPTSSGGAATMRGLPGLSSPSGQGAVEILSAESSDEELLRTFLETGAVPWWAGQLAGAELEARFVAMIERHRGQVPEWLRGQGGSQRIARRLLGQFSQAAALKLLAALVQETGAEGLLEVILDVAPPGLAQAAWQRGLAEALLPELLSWPLQAARSEELIVALAARTAALQGSDAQGFLELLSRRRGSVPSSPAPGARSSSAPDRAELSPRGVEPPSADAARASSDLHSRRTREAEGSSQQARTELETNVARPQDAELVRAEVQPHLKAEAAGVASAPGGEAVRAPPGAPSMAATGPADSQHAPRATQDSRHASQSTLEPRAASDSRQGAPPATVAPTEAQPPASLASPEPLTQAAQDASGQRLPTPSAQHGSALPLPGTPGERPQDSGRAPPPSPRGPVSPVAEAARTPSVLQEPGMRVARPPTSPAPHLQSAGGETRALETRGAADASQPHHAPLQAPSDAASSPARAPHPTDTGEAHRLGPYPPETRSPTLEPTPPSRTSPPRPPGSFAPASPFAASTHAQLLAYGLPVDNAGLVILHPFLKTFFQAVGLFEGKGFRDLAAQCRAVCLLQWLAHDVGAEDEHRMALSKLLCGVPLEEVVPRIDGPTEAERTEGEELLRHVVAQWTVLKNTSARGLRESFLQRGGLLRKEETGWVLRMEARAYDMLLDRLPWGLSHIQLSWMAGLLRVER
ncbi:MAG: hypothetical protein JXB05_33015 [Myxococcaceae bacterium]|nr:hypothetical protein [Myxococcaceae bacterium]